MTVEYSRRFIKEFKKCPKNIQATFAKRLELFIEDKHHPILKNHKLVGLLKGCSSINVSGDYRAIFQEFNKGQHIYFIIIGTHSQLYS